MSLSTHFQKVKKKFFDNESLCPVGLGTFVTGILYGVEYLLEKESPCPCDPKLNVRYTCICFLIPASVLFLLSLLVSSDAGKIVTWRISCSVAAIYRCKCCKNSRCPDRCSGCCPDSCAGCCPDCHFCLFTLLKVLVPSILWAAILFQDGDYFACAFLNETYRGQDCNETCASISLPHERRELCVRSQMIGGCLLVAVFLLLVVFYFLPGCLFSKENDKTEGKKAGDTEMTTSNF